MRHIVDASVVAAVIFDEPGSEKLEKLLTNGAFLAPDLLPYEVANVCARRCREDPEAAPIFQAKIRFLHKLDIVLVPVDPRDCVRLALEANLSTYDASYLYLAESLRVELITLDRRLRYAADSAPP